MTEAIYRHPDEYDLEHEGDTEDVDFFRRSWSFSFYTRVST